MASFEKSENTDDSAAAHVVEAANSLTAPDAAKTAVHPAAPMPIPPLLTEPAVMDESSPHDAESQAENTKLMGNGSDDDDVARKARVIEAAAAARDRAATQAGIVRERAAEHAGAAREKLAGSAGEAKERLADGAVEAKFRGAKMRKRIAEAASDARGSASVAAAEARERVANADVNEFAHSTTRLIDGARPFFLAGFGLLFAALGFLESDSGTAELFVGGSVIFVIGAGFSSEINAFVATKLHRQDDSAADGARPTLPPQPSGNEPPPA